MTSLRKDWFEHVKKTRKKLSRKNAPCSHVDAMKKASESWPTIKQKILRKRKRGKTSTQRDDENLCKNPRGLRGKTQSARNERRLKCFIAHRVCVKKHTIVFSLIFYTSERLCKSQ